MELSVGQEVDGRYVVSAELGAGGIARVYVAHDLRLDVPVALKVLMVPMASNRDRLRREGLAQAALTHPHVVRVSDIVPVGSSVGLVMELVQGPTLAELMEARLLSGMERLALARQLAKGVQAAHVHGLVHRDLKPGNVLVHTTGTELVAKIADFGLVKFVGTPETSGSVTRTGATMGSPQYMSPEQIRDSSRVDHRTDIFSLGSVLYELFCDIPPFVGEDTFDLLHKVVSCQYVPPGQLVELPEFLDHAIRSCLVADPEQRIPTCEVLLEMLGTEGPARVWTAETLAWVAAYARTMDRSRSWAVGAHTWDGTPAMKAPAPRPVATAEPPLRAPPSPPPRPPEPAPVRPKAERPAASAQAPRASLPPAQAYTPRVSQPDPWEMVSSRDLEHPIFRGLGEAPFRAATNQLSPIRVPAGSTLMVAGENDPTMVLVLRGALVLSSRGVVVGQAGPGDLLGGMDMVTGSNRLVDVAITEDLEALVMSRLGYRALGSESNPMAGQVEVNVITQEASWLQQLQARLASLEPKAVPAPKVLQPKGTMGRLLGMFSAKPVAQKSDIQPSTVFRALPQCELVKPHIIEGLANHFTAMKIERDQAVYLPGEPTDHVYVHAIGELGLGIPVSGGVVPLPAPHAGDVLSLTGLVDHAPHQTIAWARQPCEVLRAPLSELTHVLAGHGNVPTVLRELVIDSLYHRIAAVLEQVVRTERKVSNSRTA